MGPDYKAPSWGPFQVSNRLEDFQAVWDLSQDWVDKANNKGQGWSAVAKIALKDETGDRCWFFMKKQQDYTRRTLNNPLVGESTCRIEFRNLLQYRDLGIPCPEPVYFAERKISGELRSVLITKDLAGFIPLSQWKAESGARNTPLRERNQILSQAAALLRALHTSSIQHDGCYPKHIYIDVSGQGRAARIIDLETSQKKWFRRNAMLRDLDTLNRRGFGWTRTSKLRFLLDYLEVPAVTPKVKKLWASLARRARHAH